MILKIILTIQRVRLSMRDNLAFILIGMWTDPAFVESRPNLIGVQFPRLLEIGILRTNLTGTAIIAVIRSTLNFANSYVNRVRFVHGELAIGARLGPAHGCVRIWRAISYFVFNPLRAPAEGILCKSARFASMSASFT